MNSLPEKKLIDYRLSAVDALRGLVMIIMALDHTRELFHIGAFTTDPTDLATTTPLLFLTRWITHFCAPVFVFLSGTSIYLQSLRKTKKQLSGFLLKRGLWLIFVDLIIMTFAITFDISYGMFILQVIWAIGISMIILAGAIWLPFPVLAAAGLIIVFGHNLLDSYEKAKGADLSFVYYLLHRQAVAPIWPGHVIAMLYPFLPWTGVMISGFVFGKIYKREEQQQPNYKAARYIGFALIFIFIALRYSNSYGDPLPWASQQTPVFTILSFLNTQKYPPSLLYVCMTLGPALVLLSYMTASSSRFSSILTTYGRVPFFYYILHFYILHLVTSIFYLLRGHSFQEGIKGQEGFPFHFVVPGEGLSLTTVYLIWILLVLGLYPLCLWFARYKQTNKKWWLSYI